MMADDGRVKNPKRREDFKSREAMLESMQVRINAGTSCDASPCASNPVADAGPLESGDTESACVILSFLEPTLV